MGEAHGPVHLMGDGCGAAGGLTGANFGHRDAEQCLRAGVDVVDVGGASAGHQGRHPCGGHLTCQQRKLLLNCLVFADGPAKLHPVIGILHGLFQHPFERTYQHHAARQCPQRAHRLAQRRQGVGGDGGAAGFGQGDRARGLAGDVGVRCNLSGGAVVQVDQGDALVGQ